MIDENEFCDVCGTQVVMKRDHTGIYRPISKYWNASKNVIYCSAQCSLKGHTLMKANHNDV